MFGIMLMPVHQDLHQDEGFDGYWFANAYRNSRNSDSNIYTDLTMPRWS